MNDNALSATEQRLWNKATTTGEFEDLRTGDSALDAPERGSEWGPERVVRAEVIAEVVLGDDKTASQRVRGVRLRGARITGQLNLEAATLRCPLDLEDCYFDDPIFLQDATAQSVSLSRSRAPLLGANHLQTRGDLSLNGFSTTGGALLVGAHIGGQLDCRGGQFVTDDAFALNAPGLVVDGDMLCREGFAATGGVYLPSAHIGGVLDFRGCRLSGGDHRNATSALWADGLFIGQWMSFGEGSSAMGEVSLRGAQIGGDLKCAGTFSNAGDDALTAGDLLVKGNLLFTDFTATGRVDLAGSRISGLLSFSGCHLSDGGLRDTAALWADGLTVGGLMSFGEEFSATGVVTLAGADIGDNLICAGAFSNLGDTGVFSEIALSAEGLIVHGNMTCGKNFTATGQVDLTGAHISGDLTLSGGQFSNKGDFALEASRLAVKGDMTCGTGFTGKGGVDLTFARIGGVLNCSGGQFVMSGDGKSDGKGDFAVDRVALFGLGLTVERAMLCGKGFSATGNVLLAAAQLGELDCTEGYFSNAGGVALDLERATVNGELDLESATLEGGLDLTGAKVGSYHDNRASWPAKPAKLRLDRFSYDAIEGSPVRERLKVKERLEWLRRNAEGYSPQIYNQLADVYQRAGDVDHARRILIAKQWRRSVKGGPVGILWGALLNVTVGYGYRLGRALVWWLVLLALGTVLFGYVDPHDLKTVSQPTIPPQFQPFFYTLDLLLPFVFTVTFPHSSGLQPQGPALWWSLFFNVMGWILGVAVVASVTGFTKRDIQ